MGIPDSLSFRDRKETSKQNHRQPSHLLCFVYLYFVCVFGQGMGKDKHHVCDLNGIIYICHFLKTFPRDLFRAFPKSFATSALIPSSSAAIYS